MFQHRAFISFLVVISTLVNADIIISDLAPRDRQSSTNGSVTLSARVKESNPSNSIRQAKFKLRENGNTVSEENVKDPSSGDLYTVQVNNLSAGVEYCFQVEARNRFFASKSSAFSCFTIDGDQSAQQPAESFDTSNIKYGLQDDCFAGSSGQFNICLDLSSPTGAVEGWFGAFTAARATWESAVTFNGVNANPAIYDRQFTATGSYPPTIDGLYIASKAEFVDGPGGVLGSASPIYYQTVNGRKMVSAGRMRFDYDDIQRLVERGTFANLIEHEMGHVLGIGTTWGLNNVYTANNVNDNLYRGAAVNREWAAQGCQTVGGFAPIVETDGGRSTAFFHFDEKCFGDELMTGFIDVAGTTLSRFTIASLEDIGYSVNYGVGEAFAPSPECCNPGGRRRLNDPAKKEAANAQTTKRRLSSRMMQIAQEYGREELSRLRQVREVLRERMGSFIEDEDTEAADFVNVLVEEDGEIFDVRVSDDNDEDGP